MGELASTLYLPVAYLPGASGCSASWEPIASVLASRREPRLIDYPGLGEQPEVPGLRDLAALTHWVQSELPEVCDVVTLSMGSALGLRLALDYPERVRRLVLVAPCGGLGVSRFGALDWREAFVEQRPQAPRWFVDDQSDFSDRLNDISIPTLLVFGDDDVIAPPAIGEYLMDRLPSARLEVIEDASHDLEEEHPAFVASLIEAHLRR
jgi:pimeloyl-ACP methyl ester carboxylesterase